MAKLGCLIEAYVKQTCIFFWSIAPKLAGPNHASAVPSEDLFAWTEHSTQASYIKNDLKKMHKNRLIEYDQENQMVTISPLGINLVEDKLLDRT